MLFSLMLLAMQTGDPYSDQPVDLHQGGFCAGSSWITLSPEETVTVDLGPDFRVFRIQGPGQAWWGVYSGHASQVSDARRKRLTKRGEFTIYAVSQAGEFRGYLARDGKGWRQQHFFGSVFTNSRDDARFFDRVEYGPEGVAKCKEHPGK